MMPLEILLTLLYFPAGMLTYAVGELILGSGDPDKEDDVMTIASCVLLWPLLFICGMLGGFFTLLGHATRICCRKLREFLKVLRHRRALRRRYLKERWDHIPVSAAPVCPHCRR